MRTKNSVKEVHPCFGARANRGRIHLPICPSCNIQCAFCRRSINKDENRPGVASFILTVDKVNQYISDALQMCPEISVVGVAGPGESLIGENLIKAFKSVGKEFPQLLKCMSTNGLLLNEKADELIEVGVDTLTVTVNAIDPEILAKIVMGIYYKGKRYEGTEAAALLIENQIKGIKKMAASGVTIKINTVLIPEINQDHIYSVANKVSSLGADLYNIIPLIPQYRLSHLNPPSCQEIDRAREVASEHVDVFRHCQHCRADAVGIPGVNDFAGKIFLERAEETFSHG
ncbi:MAG: radical SAM protein [Syntrophomonadaceae bacterium]|nr:radical SAM protein [Syntrophomonadaceae bacterium]